MWHCSFYPLADNYLLVCGIALVLLALLALRPGGRKTTRRRRVALAGIRLAVIVLVVLAMLRPTLVYTETEMQAATWIVLVDGTRSMSVPDVGSGTTRWEALRGTLDEAQDAMRKLGEDIEVKAYTFDAEAHPAEVVDGQIRLPEAPTGQETAIGAVLDDVLRGEAGKRLLGILLLSDGAQRAYPPRDVLPHTAARRMKLLGFPLYTCRFGKSRGLGQAQDVAVKELLANQAVYVKTELSVTGQVRADGFVNREVSVQLLVETGAGQMEPVAQENLKVLADGELIPVHFTYVPQLPGEYRISLQAVEQPGELATTNNRLSTFVNVLKGGLNVLYLEGELRPEIGFLRRAVDGAPEVSVQYAYINPRWPQTRPHDLPERFKPGKFDVYILGDLDSSVFEGTELEDLADTVFKGAGLIMLGGTHSFGPGGYAETPLAKVLPVKMDRLERQGLDDAVSRDLHLAGPLEIVPTAIGLGEYPMVLGSDERESRAIWAQVPALPGANRFDALKTDALVFAETKAGQPVLVAYEHGRGRVMAFAADSTWLWCTHGYEAIHQRFWRQVVLWLARKDESAEGNVRIKLPQRRFGPGQRVQFSVEAQSPTGEPIQDADYQAEIILPDDSKKPLPLVRGAGQTTGSFRDTEQPGDYAIRVTASKDGQVLGTARSRLLVSEQDLELDNAAADATLLESLAAMTGGKALVPEEVPGLIGQLTEDKESLEVRRETKTSLWDTWGLLLLVIGLLGTEWYLRKRWGLV